MLWFGVTSSIVGMMWFGVASSIVGMMWFGVTSCTACYDKRPGTPFMVRLQEHLRHFVNKKITEDPMWKHITVILDGTNNKTLSHQNLVHSSGP